MNFYLRRFNLYLLLLVVACGCSPFHKKKIAPTAAIRIHVETEIAMPEKSHSVPILRSQPVTMLIDDEPAVTERNLLAATLLDTPGGFSIRVKFDETGTWMLEQATAANPGRHLCVFVQWGETKSEGRWLAAPLITGRIANGQLTFTPDASREEALKVVTGLNHTAKIENTGKAE